MRVRRLGLVVAFILCAALAVAAHAETTARRSALADVLFQNDPFAALCL